MKYLIFILALFLIGCSSTTAPDIDGVTELAKKPIPKLEKYQLYLTGKMHLITSNCYAFITDDGVRYELIGAPEDIIRTHRYLRIIVNRLVSPNYESVCMVGRPVNFVRYSK